jgi:hypothetical protein
VVVVVVSARVVDQAGVDVPIKASLGKHLLRLF